MKLPTFSYSAFDSHSKCPKNYKFTKRDYLCEACKKGPVPRDSVTCPFCNISFIKDAAMARGLDHHGHIEAYIKGEVDTLPPIGNDSAKICVEKLRSARAANPATPASPAIQRTRGPMSGKSHSRNTRPRLAANATARPAAPTC